MPSRSQTHKMILFAFLHQLGIIDISIDYRYYSGLMFTGYPNPGATYE